MKRTKITRDTLAEALRFLRTSGGLTQKSVSERAAEFQELGFGRLLESQISDFERGKALPSLGTLINLLAACSDDGRHVDFRNLQVALEFVGDAAGAEAAPRWNPAPRGEPEELEKAVTRLAERWTLAIRGEMSHQKDEVAELRARLAQTERLMASLLGERRRESNTDTAS